MSILNRSLPVVFFLLQSAGLAAQDSAKSCKVELAMLTGSYKGDCKNGYANGKGEALGTHRYAGLFKNGLPHGKGTYYYTDGSYYTGSFQNGIKEGKGEMHYLRNTLSDSLIKGYWSADEYRGNTYKTYSFITSEIFDSYEVTPSPESGNTLTIEISTTTGSPNGGAVTLTSKDKFGYVLTLADIIPLNDCILTKMRSNATGKKTSYIYLLSKFPADLFLTLSNGRTINLQLYKAAKWTMRLYLNK